MGIYCLDHGQSGYNLGRLQRRSRTAAARDSQLPGHHERPVVRLLIALKLDQPSVSKHLGVCVRWAWCGCAAMAATSITDQCRGDQASARLVNRVEKFWQHQLARVKQRAEEKANPSK